MSLSPRLVSLATAAPPYVLAQDDVAAIARHIFDSPDSEIEYMLPIFENAGIGQRHSCVPLEWYLERVGWKARNALYLDNALDLIEIVASDCLQGAGLRPDQVDAIVCVSTTGLSTPSLDARLMDRMAFREDLQRLPLFGLGCAGGALGLARAATWAQATPGSRVLLLVVELCGLTFRPGDQSRANIVATALFGDGAAAALVTTDPGADGPRVMYWGEHRWPDSLGVMGWRVEDDGFGVLFSRDIPTLIRERFADATDRFLARHGLSRGDLAGYVCHPGGAKVVAALEEVLGLAPGAMARAREVLRDYGNMSAPSVLFVLEKVLDDKPEGRLLVSSLGPGFSAAFVVLDTP
jgi:alkylresorcinol/alkylpyrone synthase